MLIFDEVTKKKQNVPINVVIFGKMKALLFLASSRITLQNHKERKNNAIYCNIALVIDDA